MEQVDGVVAVHRLMSRSALLLDRVIREVAVIQERGQPLPHGDVDRLEPPLGEGSSDDEFDYDLVSRPVGEGHPVQPLRFHSDQEVLPSHPRLPSAIQDEDGLIGEGHLGQPLRFDSDHEVLSRSHSHRPRLPLAIHDEEPPLGEGHGRPPVRFKDNFDFDFEVPMPSPLRRSKSESSLCVTDRRRHNAPRFVGPIPPAPAPLPGDETYPILAPDVEEDGGFRGQVLLLEYPDARPVGPYAASTIYMSQRMLEAGTGTGEQPLVRAAELVGLAAMAVAGQSPPRHLHQHPSLRASVLELVQSAQDMRRHPIGSPDVRSLVAELGGRLELVGTDILTERRSLHDTLPMLRLVKNNLDLLWDMRVPAKHLKLM